MSDLLDMAYADLDRQRAENDALKLRVKVLEKALAEISAPPPTPWGRVRRWEDMHFLETWEQIPALEKNEWSP